MSAPKITPLNIGYLRADVSEWYGLPSDHPMSRKVEEAPILCYHIAVGAHSVLVDAPAYEFPGDAAEMAIPGFKGRSLLELLAAAEIDAAGIRDVVITHAHWDHINGLTRLVDNHYVPTFPQARHYLGKGDWQPEQFEELENNTLKVVHSHGLLTLLDGSFELGEGLTILPAPGESPGHQILHLHVGGTEAYFVGDLYHHPLEFAEPDRNVQWAAPDTMQASKAALIQHAAQSGARVFFAHIESPYRVQLTGRKPHWQAA